jgi:RND family efflux transporter MFP subunit
VAGQVVKKGDTLLSVGGVPRGAPEVQHAQVDVEFARRELTRVRRLVDEKLATNQELQQAEQQLAGAETALRSLGATGAGAVALQAPTDGIVAEVLVQPGAQVQQGQPGVTLASRNALSVHVGFEVEDMGVLQSGQVVLLSPVFAKDGVTPLRAQLSTLHRVVDAKTQLVEALISVPDPAPWMASGLAVRAVVIVNGAHDVVRVPLSALLERDGKSGVFVVEQDHARFRELQLGVAGAAFREARQGLSPGDAVVTVGQSTLTDGMLVRATEAPGR